MVVLLVGDTLIQIAWNATNVRRDANKAAALYSPFLV